MKSGSAENHQGSGTAPEPFLLRLRCSNSIHFLYPVLLVLIFAPVYALIFDTKLDLNGDNARYYVLGKALSLGRGYVDIHTRDENPAGNVPPGYPAIIGLVMKLASSDFAAVKTANGIFFLAAIISLFFYSNL